MPRAVIIDDDPGYHRLTGALIDKYGVFDYVSYTDPRSALIDLIDCHFSSKVLPDLILLDLKMPGVSGWEFLESFDNLRAVISKEIPVFIVTSSVDPNDTFRSKQYSAVKGFFSKPISPDNLKTIADRSVKSQ